MRELISELYRLADAVWFTREEVKEVADLLERYKDLPDVEVLTFSEVDTAIKGKTKKDLESLYDIMNSLVRIIEKGEKEDKKRAKFFWDKIYGKTVMIERRWRLVPEFELLGPFSLADLDPECEDYFVRLKERRKLSEAVPSPEVYFIFRPRMADAYLLTTELKPPVIHVNFARLTMPVANALVRKFGDRPKILWREALKIYPRFDHFLIHEIRHYVDHMKKEEYMVKEKIIRKHKGLLEKEEKEVAARVEEALYLLGKGYKDVESISDAMLRNEFMFEDPEIADYLYKLQLVNKDLGIKIIRKDEISKLDLGEDIERIKGFKRNLELIKKKGRVKFKTPEGEEYSEEDLDEILEVIDYNLKYRKRWETFVKDIFEKWIYKYASGRRNNMKNIISELCRIAAKVERRKVKEEIEEKEVRWDKLKELVEMLSGQAGRGLGEIGEELLMRRRTLKKLEEASDLKSKDLERLLEK